MAYRKISKDGYVLAENIGGKLLGFAPDTALLEQDGFVFKDLNRNGILDPYEDWRLSPQERAEDLAGRLSAQEIAGLMLYSAHQSVSRSDALFATMFGGHYNGKKLSESDADVADLTDEQKQFLKEDGVRHVLVTVVDGAGTAARWNNRLQCFAEGLGKGIPVNISSDPRHSTTSDTEFNAGAGGDISKWPEPLGLAAAFSPELVYQFGKIASCEYRAMGIATALSPQVDIATDPRWMRFNGTFGEDPRLSAELARAYCDGFQTSGEGGFGPESVNAMVKHWPGGGSGEGGRDAHYGYGKYAVYPGGRFADHLTPFVDGAFDLRGGTEKACAVMPYYTISYGIDQASGENVGNGYSRYILTDLLRGVYHYDGVVCTDWSVTHNHEKIDAFISGKCWGVEDLSEEERHLKALFAGVDQFGGNNDAAPVLGAYHTMARQVGEEAARARFEASAGRLLRNIFQVGLFEQPYLDPAESQKTVGCPAFMQAGYEAQKKSIVLLKNKDKLLPLKGRKKVYIPSRKLSESVDWFGNTLPAREVFPVEELLVKKYFDLVPAQEADFALVFIESPQSVGYTEKDGYLPINLQYRPYTALTAREKSIAGGDPLEEGENRSYRGKTGYASNEKDLDVILETRAAMGKRPVVVCLEQRNPTVVAEFEGAADALLSTFGVSAQAVFELLTGAFEPSGLLPFQMPKDMQTVEAQQEDVFGDMAPYLDEDGNTYDFAFGLNFEGKINDERTRKYAR